jgi:hypothetical protein
VAAGSHRSGQRFVAFWSLQVDDSASPAYSR